MNPNVIFIDENIPYLAAALSNCGTIHRFCGRLLTNDTLRQSECSALFVRSTTQINETLLDKTHVGFLGTATSGIDHVDTEYLARNGIAFAYAPGSNANSVAEYVVYSMLKWSQGKNQSLSGKTIGIIGFGHIGKLVAKYSDLLGMNVLANDPPLYDNDFNDNDFNDFNDNNFYDNNFKFPDYVKYAGLGEIFGQADVVTNHVPLTKAGDYPTYGLIGKEQINLLADGSLLIHASRGGVVKEAALINRLRRSEIEVAIDVWENEPGFNPELAKLSMLCSPHVAGYSMDGKLRGVLAMMNAYRDYSGQNPDFGEVESLIKKKNYIPIQEYSNEKRLYNQIGESREFESDTIDLLNAVELPVSRRKEAFDLLRKNYPKRREVLWD